MHKDTSLGEIAISLENILAINFYGRSGSLFIQSLFDGHPNVITSAGVFLHFLYGFYDRYHSLSWNQLTEKFTIEFAAIFDSSLPFTGWSKNLSEDHGLTKMGPKQNQFLTLNKEKFLAVMNEIGKDCNYQLSKKFYFQAVHLAYHLALGRELPTDGNILIVFPFHNLSAKQAEDFGKNFPKTKYLYPVREPILSLASLAKHIKGEIPWSFEQILFGAMVEKPLLSEFSRAIKIEELNQEPRLTLQAICSWLNIPWHNTLLSSTFHGLTWWGNSSTASTGFSSKIASIQSYAILSKLDISRLEILLEPKYKAWNYFLSRNCCSLLAKLKTLLLLALLFKPELTNILYRRQKKLHYSFQQLRAHKSLKNILRLFMYGTFLFLLIDYIKLRVVLIKAWLYLFQQKKTEVQLLPSLPKLDIAAEIERKGKIMGAES